MRSDLLPLSRYAVDRDGAARADAGLLRRLWGVSSTRVVLVHRGLVAVAGGSGLDLARPADLPDPFGAAEGEGPDLAYLGRDARASYLAWVLSDSAEDESDFAGLPADLDDALVEGRSWATLRDVGAALGDRDAGLAATAVALAAWHARHPRCPRCGEPTEPVESGWARRCAADASLHHPRTDPAIIVALTDDADRLLLAHAGHWPARRYSVVAGYVEPGESLEAAVRREVAEECSLVIGEPSYQGSQPWPFPSSLMLGFRARVTGGDLAVDGREITDARFVSRAALPGLVADGAVRLPMRASIARALIEEWLGAPVPGE